MQDYDAVAIHLILTPNTEFTLCLREPGVFWCAHWQKLALDIASNVRECAKTYRKQGKDH